MARRWTMVRTAHRFGIGRPNPRLRRAAQSLPGAVQPPAPIGHNGMPEGDSEPNWLKERPMSDDWNNQHQEYQPQEQHHDSWQGHGHEQPIPDAPFEAEQHDPSPETKQPVHEAWQHSDAEPGPQADRIAAVETAIAELKSSFEELRSGLATPAANSVAAPEADHAAAHPAAVKEGDRLDAIEHELAHIRTLVGEMAHAMSTIGADVKAHTDLHAETRAVVDEQHQLMRGLNYIITTAIGTLTASAKQVK